jgi:hypothetical protein
LGLGPRNGASIGLGLLAVKDTSHCPNNHRHTVIL